MHPKETTVTPELNHRQSNHQSNVYNKTLNNKFYSLNTFSFSRIPAFSWYTQPHT